MTQHGIVPARRILPEPLTLDALDVFVAHAVRHAGESGADGDRIFMPYGKGDLPSRDRMTTHRKAAWPLPLSQPGWVRTWVVMEEQRIVGHADLTGGGLRSGLHRCWLGMGLERTCRGEGWGGRLLDLTIAWAQAQDQLQWLDLGVFAHNQPARRLYESRGFAEVGRTEDRFRVDGVQIDDVQMTLHV